MICIPSKRASMRLWAKPENSDSFSINNWWKSGKDRWQWSSTVRKNSEMKMKLWRNILVKWCDHISNIYSKSHINLIVSFNWHLNPTLWNNNRHQLQRLAHQQLTNQWNRSECNRSMIYSGRYVFVSYRTFIEFVMTSFLIIVLPVISVLILNQWVKDRTDISELMKVVIAVGPAVVFINIVMGIYTYKAIKDPLNYQKDEGL